jgi:hypothetical protein
MSATVTHNLIIADRSEGGMFAVDTILDICPAAEGHIVAWFNRSILPVHT